MLDTFFKALCLAASVLYFSSVSGTDFITSGQKPAQQNNTPNQNTTPNNAINNRLTALEAKVQEIQQQNVHGTMGVKHPTADTTIDQTHFFFTADALYWKAYEDGLEFAMNFPHFPPAGSLLPLVLTKGHLVAPHFTWTAGFRVGMGYDFPYDEWEIYANWTHWINKCSNSATNVSSTGRLVAIFDTYDQILGFLASAHGRWRMTYNVLDLALRRHYFLSRHFALRPQFGLRGAWLDQNLDVHYFYSAPLTTADYHGHTFYRALGLLAGTDLFFYFNKGISLWGTFLASLVYGKANTSNQVTIVSTSPFFPRVGDNNIVDNHDHPLIVRGSLQTGAGIQYETDLMQQRFHLTISLGWEFTIWYRQNILRQFIDLSAPIGTVTGEGVAQKGDLSLQGVTLSGRIDF